METNPIETWWSRVSTPAKEWLRENLRSTVLPDHVVKAIRDAGGPSVQQQGGSDLLGTGDWQFIETQSEFVD
ncbi:hypothetical protein [Arthrobacter sp. H14]|uniref:hypothetical protein n=1 Tax=Arthrobacter sp. H14 TaxID=1312959 RepID=UPI0004B92679|nr:hypothetical protein [Arthrobacter sp. H14]